MNKKATVTPELFGPADSEGRKLIFLRVFWRGKHNRYSSGSKIRLTKEQFSNPRLKVTALALEEIEPAVTAAMRIADRLGAEFSFYTFKKQYRRALFNQQENDDVTISSAASLYFENRDITSSTKELYSIAVNWMTRYVGDIRLADISPDIIKGYVAFMKKEHQNADFLRRKKRGEAVTIGRPMSENTVRINLRSLRAIYNYGVKKYDLTLKNPFHDLENQRTSSIPRMKDALSTDDLMRLVAYEPANSLEELAKDFFILTVQLSGANLGDILSLRNCDIHGDKIWFSRRKTNRGGLVTKIPFTQTAKELFKKYGVINPSSPEREILYILWDAKTEKLRKSRTHDLGKLINKGLTTIAETLCMERFTLVIARHSFTVFAASNGFTIEQIQHFMGHASPKTTSLYVKSIDSGVIKRSGELLESLTKQYVKPSPTPHKESTGEETIEDFPDREIIDDFSNPEMFDDAPDPDILETLPTDLLITDL